MKTSRAALLLIALGTAYPLSARAQRDTPLRVVRVTPTEDAGPFTAISVTFDRPVAGSLDRSIDPATILRVTPAIPGKLEWRDPVTIRLTPSAPLVPGTRYSVSVANSFRAMDGSALAEPRAFTFRASGPLLLGGSPVGGDRQGNAQHLAANTRFELVYSSPADLTQLSTAAYLEFSGACGGQSIIRLTATSQRRIRANDPGVFVEAGGWQRDHSADSLRRVVQLTAQTQLPRGCAGELIAPREANASSTLGMARWSFATYGDFRIAKLQCSADQTNAKSATCPRGPLTITFTNPVRGSELLRRVKLIPATKFTVRDTSFESTTWTIEATLKPRVGYAAVADTSIRDVFGQALTGNPAVAFVTTGFAPFVNHPFGRLVVERAGAHTLVVQHANIDTLVATIAPVPDSLEARALRDFGEDSLWTKIARGAIVKRVAVRNVRDRPMATGVSIPTLNAMRAGTPALFVVKIGGRAAGVDVPSDGGVALIQVTDLGVHVKLGPAEGAVFVTGVNDGKVRPGATVVVYDGDGKRVATTRTNANGLARFQQPTRRSPRDTTADDDDENHDFEGYATVTLGTDRAVTVVNRWDADLSPYRFNVYNAWGDERLPLAGALFTERGIYRPGERVYAKAIVRTGTLGNLHTPGAGDSIRWVFHDRDEGLLREVTTSLTTFGTASQVLPIPTSAAVGEYAIEVRAKYQGKWHDIASASYRVAEYRPPEFLVELNAPTITRLPGDKFTATAQARYLFGAPMGGAVIAWAAEQIPVPGWELDIPGTEGWYVGDSGAWWEDGESETTEVFASRTDTLDATGARTFTVALPPSVKGRASRVTVGAVVTDINRQTVSSSTTTIVHPAEFYVAAKASGDDWFWKAGQPQSILVMTVRPDGRKTTGARVAGTIVRREWHRVLRMRDGVSEQVGEWVSDTIARCAVTSATNPVPCTFTPREGGMYVITLNATDSKGHPATTSFQRWASGEGWVPWSDETQFKMDVIPDRTKYAVGDTATIMFASPFTNADAWITVEREGLIDQRKIHITSGSTTLKLPITEAFAPNAFVSILVARGRSAPPGSLNDAGRPTIRVGYAELRVTPEVKRLSVTAVATKQEYRPGDTATVRLQIRDKVGRGARSEVALWAVDEGVLALTGYKTPDPLELIYRARGLGMRLASNMTAVAPQIPEGEKGFREAGGGGGVAGADILRSKFQTTAFFLGAVVTDAQGNATASAKLPDNLTTFRLMAVAVTAGDRYGSGQSNLLVTRPLLARQALPRFVRPGDEITAGAVINRRDGARVDVTVNASATGITLRGDATQTVTLAALKGTEVRFPFQAVQGDSATFRFDVSDTRNADAVRAAIAVKPVHHPVVHTVAGVLRDTATVSIALPNGMDLERSRLALNIDVSPLATIRGMQRSLRIYPYYCSEQIVSTAIPIIALYAAQRQMNEIPRGDPKREIARAVEILSSRQKADGGIGYWSASDWSSPWLSAYAGLMMLDARDAGADVKVDPRVLTRLSEYLTTQLHADSAKEFSPVARYADDRGIRLREQIASVDFLSRFRKPDVAAENELLRTAAQLTIEDRARLAEILMRRKQIVAARRLMESIWTSLRVDGARAVLTDTSHNFYFDSRIRPVARILTATLAVDSTHALIGPLAETLAQHNRGFRGWEWNTQDFASSATALSALDRFRRTLPARLIRVRSDDKIILSGSTLARNTSVDSSIALNAVMGTASRPTLALSLDAGAGDTPVYYYFTVTEVPVAPPVTPEDRGIQVERWYERLANGTPVQSVAEGDLVRVRLRITVPVTREFVVLDDALPAGLEAVDLSLRTSALSPGPGVAPRDDDDAEQEEAIGWYGSWDSGWWSPFDHREIRDDRVVYSATLLWKGTYTTSYIARATTPGTFIRPPAHAEEMYNPGVNGRSDGGRFVVTAVPKVP